MCHLQQSPVFPLKARGHQNCGLGIHCLENHSERNSEALWQLWGGLSADPVVKPGKTPERVSNTDFRSKFQTVSSCQTPP